MLFCYFVLDNLKKKMFLVSLYNYNTFIRLLFECYLNAMLMHMLMRMLMLFYILMLLYSYDHLWHFITFF